MNTHKIEDEIASHIKYLLEQRNEAIKLDPPSNEQHFLNEILFWKTTQLNYLFNEQSLKDIQRCCTNGLTPTSFCITLAIDTAFNNGSHYIPQAMYIT